MKRHKMRSRLAAAAVSILAVGTMALNATPASAKSSDGYVRGYDTYVGDWGDEGTLATGSAYSSSNATCLWQKVLWAEGAREQDGSTFDQADITGHFSNNTAHATAWLQAKWKLSSIDGWVGNETFGRADDNMRKASGSEARGEQLNLTYRGTDWSFSLRRDGQGIYSFLDGDAHRRNAGYDYRTCS